MGGQAYWHVQYEAKRKWELTVQSRPKIKAGRSAEVVIEYGDDTTRPEDIEGALYGWVTTRDGAMVANEPDGAMTWYPVSDHPTDKATYGFESTVPDGEVAVANGLPARDPTTDDGWTRWFWDAPDPQASYLSTASVGDYELRESVTPGGLPVIDAIDDTLTNLARTNASLALPVRSSTTPWARRWRPRPGRRTPGPRAKAPSSTSWRTSGSATRSAHTAGPTSGSTRAGRRTHNGSGPRTRVVTPRRPSSTT